VSNREKGKKRERREELVNIEGDLDMLYSNFPDNIVKEEDKV